MSWVGGKKALREEVVKRFPLFYERYIEVFGGGGWVLFHKNPGNDFEVYNDFNGLLTNLYRCVREKPDLLINSLKYVLNSREDFERVRRALDTRRRTTDIQRASWFYQIIRYSYASALTSFGAQPHDMWSNFPLIEQAHRRLAIVNPEGDASNYGQNAFFYDAAEGLLTAVILLLAEYLPPTGEEQQERRHIVSVFKLVQDLLAPSKTNKGKNGFQVLMDSLPDTHKARWFAGAALNSADQAMASVMSTVLSRLNAFLDSELEQVLCFDSAIDAETFASEKSAIFLILPEEDPSKNFMAGLMIQTLSRELFAVADENGGKLKNRVMLFCDELGTMPAFDILPLFSAGRSRKLTLVPIIQSLAQLEKNYGKEGAQIIQDNVQDTIFGGFAPNSQTAEVLSKALGSRTVLSGSVSRGKNDPSQSLQMIERPLMTADELKSISKGHFVVMKTGIHPMQTRLRLFLEWGITFGEPYVLPEKATRTVAYASRQELEEAIFQRHYAQVVSEESAAAAMPDSSGGMAQGQRKRPKREQSGSPANLRA